MTPAEIVSALALKIRERRVSQDKAAALLAGFTAEALTTTAGGIRHDAQYALVTDTARWIVAMCSRRAGKSVSVAQRFALGSMARPRGIRLYLALTGGQARDQMWEPIWKPLCAKWRLCEESDHNETRMVTTFPNGSVVRFRGTDDIRNVKKELGAGLDEACVDEAQDQPDELLRDLCIRILNNAMMDRRGTLIVSGVVPEIESGYFMELYQRSKWSKHNWSQMDNPHMPHARAELDEYLDKNPGLTIDSPVVQRERFGKFIYDAKATAYGYTPDVNGYEPVAPTWLDELFAGEIPEWLEPAMKAAKLDELPFAHWTQEPHDDKPRFGVMASAPHAGINRFSMAADPGTSDRASISVIGWGGTTEEVQHVFEWSTPRKAGTSLGRIAVWMAVAMHYYDCESVQWDPGSGKMEIDTFQTDYNLPVIKAANKTEVAPQIRRNNDLLTKGLLKVMIGSAAEQDYRRARKAPNSTPGGPWKWATNWHPDPSGSMRYALAGYYSAFEPPPPEQTPEQEARAKAIVGMARRRAAMSAHRTEEDEEMQHHFDED